MFLMGVNDDELPPQCRNLRQRKGKKASIKFCPLKFVKNFGSSKILLTFPAGFYTMIERAGYFSLYLVGRAVMEAFFLGQAVERRFYNG